MYQLFECDECGSIYPSVCKKCKDEVMKPEPEPAVREEKVFIGSGEDVCFDERGELCFQ